MPPLPDRFASRRPPALLTSLALAACMVLYPLAGALLFTLFADGAPRALERPDAIGDILGTLRWVQVSGQLLALALPALLLAALHVRRAPLSRESFAFLGLGTLPSLRATGLAMLGAFLLQPTVYTLVSLQELYLWPALGEYGREVLRNQAVMESFLGELARARSMPEFLAVAAVLAVVPALTEELFFRGYVQQNYAAAMRPAAAILLTGLLFAFFHLQPANMAALALLGWYIGYIYSVTGNLAVPIAVHLANNLVALGVIASGLEATPAMAPGPLLATPGWWLLLAGSLSLFALVAWRLGADQNSATALASPLR